MNNPHNCIIHHALIKTFLLEYVIAIWNVFTYY